MATRNKRGHRNRKNHKTRKNRSGQEHGSQIHATRSPIQHHHFLLRMETKTCPLADDKAEVKTMISRIIRDIKMKLLGEPRVYYVTIPHYNEGLTALAPIQTSHIAFHFWKNPEPQILKNADSKCLLQFDIYTCGSMSLHNIQQIFHHLTHYQPTHVNATILNRNYSLTLERQLLWDNSSSAWTDWIERIPHM